MVRPKKKRQTEDFATVGFPTVAKIFFYKKKCRLPFFSKE
jgi:hypothetical protein